MKTAEDAGSYSTTKATKDTKGRKGLKRIAQGKSVK